MKGAHSQRSTAPQHRRRARRSALGLRSLMGVALMSTLMVVVIPVLEGAPAGVAAAAANPVGTFTSKTGTALASLAVTPQTVGDVLVVFAEVETTGPTVSSVTGGGVATWTKGGQFAGSDGVDSEIWFGKITTTGSATVSFTWSSSISGHAAEYGAQEFSAGLGANTVWALDKTAGTNGASSTTVPFPSLTPSGSGELYFGYAQVANSAAKGATTGFTYAVTTNGNAVTYDPNVSGTVAPTATQSPAGVSTSVGVLLSASGGTPPPVPTVTGVSPNTGPNSGGTTVIITGTGLTGATAVKFGATTASFTVNSATQITASSPVESNSTVDITVTTPGGTSAVNAPADQFTFTTPTQAINPVGTFTSKTGTALASLAVTPQTVGDVLVVFAEVETTGPTVSSVTGGGVATWTKGGQFAGSDGVDSEIWFGKITTTGSATVSFTWSSSISGHAAEYGAQEFSAGLGANTVWALDKTAGTNGASSTTVPFPSLTPSGSGELYFGYAQVANSAAKGATTGFTYAVTTNGNAVTYDPNVSGTVAPTATQSPAGVSTSVGVLLSASGGTPPPVPTVTGVSPNTGPNSGGTTVIITGTGLTGATAVKFGATTASFTVNSATQITASSPVESNSTVDITVTTPGGTSAVNAPADQFTFTTPPAPTVTGLSPTSGSTAGGTSVAITGTGFTGATAVKFGASAATSFTVTNSTSMTATSPPGSAVTVDVTVTTPTAGTSAVNAPADQFTYTVPPQPTVTGTSPNTGPTSGGTSVVITGTGFTGASVVKFGTSAATSFTVNSPTSVTATAPGGSTGAVDITVTTPGGTSAVNPPGDQFTYVLSSLVISPVGTLTSSSGTALVTLAVTPQTVGDVLVVFAEVETTGHTVSSVAGGGVATWTKGEQFAGSDGVDAEIWFGKITTAGSSTVTFTWSSSISGHGAEYGAQEFERGARGQHGVDARHGGERQRALFHVRALPEPHRQRLQRAVLRLRPGRQRGDHHQQRGLHVGGHHQRQRRDLRHQRVGACDPSHHAVTGRYLDVGGCVAQSVRRCGGGASHRHRREPVLGPQQRRGRGHDHRDRVHRGHHGRFRLGTRCQLHGDELDHHHRQRAAGVHRHRRRHRDQWARLGAQRPRRPIHRHGQRPHRQLRAPGRLPT